MRFTRSIGHGIGRVTMDAHQASGKRRQQGVSTPSSETRVDRASPGTLPGNPDK